MLPESVIPVLELFTDVLHDDVHLLEVEITQQESWDDSVPMLHVVVAPLLTYVKHVDVHENFDGATLDSVREVSSSPVLNIGMNEEVTASSKDIPSATTVHSHQIAVHTVLIAPVDGSVTPAYATNSVPDPVPAVPAFVADFVPVDSNIGTQILLTDNAVSAAAAIVSRSAPIASSLVTHEVGIVQHNNLRIQHDMEIWQRIKDYMTRGSLKLLSLMSCKKKAKNRIKETTTLLRSLCIEPVPWESPHHLPNSLFLLEY